MFKMFKKEDETLEDFVEKCLYNLQRSSHVDIGKDVLKIILLRGTKEDFLDILNLLGRGKISMESFDHIVDICQRYVNGSSRTSKRDQDVLTRAQKLAIGGATRAEISNILKKLKTNMMSSISSQLYFFKAKQR